MDAPLFGRQWKLPVHQKTTPSPKVVTIPVHFVGSARKRSASESKSALKIQKVFRGFLVRKSVKKILTMKREVDEIEKMISKEEIVESIRRNSKERLRVNEMLMRLLLKLDSVLGVDSGVRDCRKTVIKKAIALQELVDAIAVGRDQILGDADDDDDEDTKENDSEIAEADQTLEFQGKAPPEVEDSSLNLNLIDNCNSLGKAVDQAQEKLDNCNSFINFETLEALEKGSDAVEDGNAEEESVGTSKTESESGSSENPGIEIEGKEGNEKEDCGVGVEGERDESRRSRELLERLLEDNDKMMGLMTQLFERNEKQTQMLSSLSQRVEQLEKAFVCEKLRKLKKKKRHAAATGGKDS